MAEPRGNSGLLEIHIAHVFDRLFESKLAQAYAILVPASADFCHGIRAPLNALSHSRRYGRSPRVLRTHLHAYACRIYVTAFRASTGLCVYGPAHPAVPPLSASCSSGQRFASGFLQIPPHGGHPCRSANTSPCRVCRGLAPPSKCALPGAPKKEGRSVWSTLPGSGTNRPAGQIPAIRQK
jgi:hypothetical protein